MRNRLVKDQCTKYTMRNRLAKNKCTNCATRNTTAQRSVRELHNAKQTAQQTAQCKIDWSRISVRTAKRQSDWSRISVQTAQCKTDRSTQERCMCYFGDVIRMDKIWEDCKAMGMMVHETGWITKNRINWKSVLNEQLLSAEANNEEDRRKQWLITETFLPGTAEKNYTKQR